MTTRADITHRTSTPTVGPLVVADGTLETIKWLAVVLMTLDHVNKFLFDYSVPWMFAAGRVAMPLFVFVLAYNAARPGFFSGARSAAGRTCVRLAQYALLAQVPYAGLAAGHSWWPLNILWTLLACIALLWSLQSQHKASGWTMVIVFCGGGLLVEYWWPALLLAAAAWRYAQSPTRARLGILIIAVASLALINQNFWALLAVLVMLAAPRVSVSVPRVRNFFYAYYPAHLAMLWLMAQHR